jgi:hypothetical protein
MASLPSLLHDLASQWNLTTTGDLLGHGYNAAVLPVRQDGRPFALKLTWPPERARKEADALAAWRARGTVELAACYALRGALLHAAGRSWRRGSAAARRGRCREASG